MNHSRPTVLVVDGQSETEEVLRAVLSPRGMEVERVRRHIGTTPGNRPELVVLHGDEDHDPDAWPGVPRVIIGRIEVEAAPHSGCLRLNSPFQYGELIQAVEHLLPRAA